MKVKIGSGVRKDKHDKDNETALMIEATGQSHYNGTHGIATYITNTTQ